MPAENDGADRQDSARATPSGGFRIRELRGLLVMSGVAADAPGPNRHIVRWTMGEWPSGRAVDDLWSLGTPVGEVGRGRQRRHRGPAVKIRI